MTPAHHALIFDLDGTLIDSIPDVWRAVNRMLVAHGLGEVPYAAFDDMVGEGARVMLERVFAYVDKRIDDSAMADALAQYLDFYKASPVSHTIVYPGVREVLGEFHDQMRPMGICTNKPAVMTDIVLTQLDLMRLFRGVTAGDNVPHRKPDGRHLASTLDAMGAAGAMAIMIGDSKTDLDAARDAGFPFIAVSYGYNHGDPSLEEAEIVIDTFADLPAAIRRLTKETL